MEILGRNRHGHINLVKVSPTYKDIRDILIYCDTRVCAYTFQIVVEELNRTIVIRTSTYSGYKFALIFKEPLTEWHSLLEIPSYKQNKHYNQETLGLLNYILKRLHIENIQPVHFYYNKGENTVVCTSEEQPSKKRTGFWENFKLLLP